MVDTLLTVAVDTTIGTGLASIAECGCCAGVRIRTRTAVTTTFVDCPCSVFGALLYTSVNRPLATTISSRAGCLVEDFHLTDGWVVLTTEVIATSAAGIATCTTLVTMTNITVLILVDVGTVTSGKVVPTTPGGTVAAAVILVAVAIPAVFEVVGQGEQEACFVSLVAATTVPSDGCITANQALTGLTRVEFHHCDGGTFSVTLVVEGRDIPSITAELVAEGPVLACLSDPTIDLLHLGGAEQRASLELIALGATFHTVVVGSLVVRALTVTSTFTATST